MTAHTHTKLVEGCFRCELGKDEMAAQEAEDQKTLADVMRRLLLNTELGENEDRTGTMVIAIDQLILSEDELAVLEHVRSQELGDEEEVLRDPKTHSILEEVERLLDLRKGQLEGAVTEVRRGLDLASKVIKDLREEYLGKPEDPAK